MKRNRSWKRTRAWRRAQAERALATVFRWKWDRELTLYKHGYYPSGFTYTRKIDVQQTIEIPVNDWESLLGFVRWDAKRARDNPHGHACDLCRNIRRQGWGNSSKVLTFKEIRALKWAVQDILESNLATDSKCRRRKYRRSSHNDRYSC